jgi:hypothetical protein
MTSKITAILTAAIVLASASVASAQTAYAPSYHNPYNNQDTRNLRYGHANDHQFDPYRGTVFEGVAPSANSISIAAVPSAAASARRHKRS